MTGKLLAYHLKSPRVPLVVRVPQFENHCNTKRKNVKPEGNDYIQKTHHNWTKGNELQRPCFKQDTKANQRWLKAM